MQRSRSPFQFSLIATAARPQYWMNLYRSIGGNSVRFELVFAGPNRPTFTLPWSFKYIQTNVKPAQCVEIASRHATGELIMQVADDLEFITEHPLDELYHLYKSFNNEKIMLSPRYTVDGIDVSDESTHFFYADGSSPTVAVGMILSRKMYRELGGMDRNFMAILGETDVAMRLYSIGGGVVLSNVYVNEDKSKCQGSDLCHEVWDHDRKIFEDLWMMNGKVQFTRTRPLEPFSDERILEESQGPKGRWT